MHGSRSAGPGSRKRTRTGRHNRASSRSKGTNDFVLKELRRNLKGYALEEFVANLVQAMGYRTKVSSQGGDSGIDIIAYKDELPPRIAVQVKSQDDDIKETVIISVKETSGFSDC